MEIPTAEMTAQMNLPPRVYAIRRMPLPISRAWAARRCEWCDEKPTYTVHYRLSGGNKKSCKLACEVHAHEASQQTKIQVAE